MQWVDGRYDRCSGGMNEFGQSFYAAICWEECGDQSEEASEPQACDTMDSVKTELLKSNKGPQTNQNDERI